MFKVLLFSMLLISGAAKAQQQDTLNMLAQKAWALQPSLVQSVLPKNLKFGLSASQHSGHTNQIDRIFVNQNLVRKYMQEPNAQNFVAFTRHKNLEQYLIATLIHEMAHIFDRSRYSLSQDPDFQNLLYYMYYGEYPTNLEKGNFYEGRSVDPYENKNFSEAFAVNLEFFLLDPEYKCRRPSLYHYLEKRLLHTPFPDLSCDKFPKKYYIAPAFSVEGAMAPQLMEAKGLLYQIHVFLAGAGQSIMSGSGHLMLRLVYCAPHRKVADEKCLSDFQNHVIISPAAGVADLSISYGAGLTGKYRSHFFAQPISSVLVQYNSIEEREILSLPLKLNHQELRALEISLLEAHWTYQNKYFFTVNNCATEVLNALKRALPRRKELSNVFTGKPIKLFERLQEVKMLPAGSMAYWSVDKMRAYYFPSSKLGLDSIERLLSQTTKSKAWLGYRFQSFAERVKLVESLQGAERTKLLHGVLYLESKIQMYLVMVINSKIQKRILEGQSGDQVAKAYNDLKKTMRNWIAPSLALSTENYGVPDESELNAILEAGKMDAVSVKNLKKMDTGDIAEIQQLEKLKAWSSSLLLSQDK